MDISSLQEFAFLPYASQKSDSTTSSYQLSQCDQSRVKIKQSSSWSYSGPLMTPDTLGLPRSIHTWLEATLEGCFLGKFLSFLSFVNSFLQANDIHHYWLTIRATKANNNYDMPRWHTDSYDSVSVKERESQNEKQNNSYRHRKGTIFSRRHSRRLQPLAHNRVPTQAFPDWKICTTMIGPQTLFIASRLQADALAVQKQVKAQHATEHGCVSIRCLGCATSGEKIRTVLAEELDRYERVQAEEGMCTLFRIGDIRGAVHSEPPMNADDRVFINVIPGTAEGLEKLMARWGMGFPRDWWTGSRMG